MIELSYEAKAFLTAMESAQPAAVSACKGWTTHEIAAHVAGITIEVVRHLDPYAQGDPVPRTRSFEEREAPLRALTHRELIARLPEYEQRMRSAVGEVLDQEPDAVIPWTGRQMAVAKFIPHLRNEHALHRWDVVGDDETSLAILGRADVVDHSVAELGRILVAAGRRSDPDPETDFVARLRSDGQRELRVVVASGEASITWAASDDDEPVLDLDAGARHLFIWGRRPADRGRLRSGLTPPQLARLQTLLAGY